MNAPKPKVRCTGSWSHDGDLMFDYTWRCDCGQHFDGGEDWHDMIHDAVKHSRTHTAERVADELDRRSGDALEKAGYGSRFSGVAYAFAKSSVLIRDHLVGRTS